MLLIATMTSRKRGSKFRTHDKNTRFLNTRRIRNFSLRIMEIFHRTLSPFLASSSLKVLSRPHTSIINSSSLLRVFKPTKRAEREENAESLVPGACVCVYVVVFLALSVSFSSFVSMKWHAPMRKTVSI